MLHIGALSRINIGRLKTTDEGERAFGIDNIFCVACVDILMMITMMITIKHLHLHSGNSIDDGVSRWFIVEGSLTMCAGRSSGEEAVLCHIMPHLKAFAVLIISAMHLSFDVLSSSCFLYIKTRSISFVYSYNRKPPLHLCNWVNMFNQTRII